MIAGLRKQPRMLKFLCHSSFSDYVQKAIKEKNECYKRLYHDRCANNIEKYKVAKKTIKRAVSEAKGWAYKDLY